MKLNPIIAILALTIFQGCVNLKTIQSKNMMSDYYASDSIYRENRFDMEWFNKEKDKYKNKSWYKQLTGGADMWIGDFKDREEIYTKITIPHCYYSLVQAYYLNGSIKFRGRSAHGRSKTTIDEWEYFDLNGVRTVEEETHGKMRFCDLLEILKSKKVIDNFGKNKKFLDIYFHTEKDCWVINIEDINAGSPREVYNIHKDKGTVIEHKFIKIYYEY